VTAVASLVSRVDAKKVEIRLSKGLAKGDFVGRIEVPSVAKEPKTRCQLALAHAPGPVPSHAASEEALLENTRAFVTDDGAPSSDEGSTRVGSVGVSSDERPSETPTAAPLRLLRSNQLAG
jgi:hypothetical protein